MLQSSLIEIYNLKLLSFEESFSSAPEPVEPAEGRGRIKVADVCEASLKHAEILVDCSKGTYIRSLARDLGEALGSGAFLGSLRRTRNGGYSIADSLTLDAALELLG